ncbi:MAG: hypothetical protein ACREQ4_08410, partial [Candidatus Binataceae bacterium]
MNRPRRPVRPTTPRIAAPGPSAQPATVSQDIEVASLHGIGPKRAAALTDHGITWCADALFHLPYRYVDLRSPRKIAELKAGDDAVVTGMLGAVVQHPMRGNRWRRLAVATLTGADGARLRVVWFNLPAYARMPSGERVLLHGRVSVGTGGEIEIVHPEVHRLNGGEPLAIRPIYSLPREVGQPLFGTIVAQAMRRLSGVELGTIPAALRG